MIGVPAFRRLQAVISVLAFRRLQAVISVLAFRGLQAVISVPAFPRIASATLPREVMRTLPPDTLLK